MADRNRISEKAFEDAVIRGLAHPDAEGNAQWYTFIPAKDDTSSDWRFDREYAMDTQTFQEFLSETQPKEVAKVERQYGEQWSEKVLKRLAQVIDDKGLLHVLRHGFRMAPGANFQLVYFKPANDLNHEAVEDYRLNRFRVTRQLRFGTLPSDRNDSLDVVAMVNGFPLVTIELKNPLTGQTGVDAIMQYQRDRDPRELIFKPDMRSLVHFAVDPDEVYMTTMLKGSDTFFLPFNKGNGHDGAGNPPVELGEFKTSYLWDEVLRPDSLLEIIQRFIQIEYRKNEGKKSVRKTPSNIKRIIFPRYHQLDAVRKLVKAAKVDGPGHNYLIQHSAGSGKSNSISWLAYELSGLTRPDGDALFDSVIVLTDRVALDNQLQSNILDMEQTPGVVQSVTHGSKELLDAINSRARVIVSTIQKFPYIYDQTDVKNRTFAVIIDEAHSSQSGEAHRKTKEALGTATAGGVDWEEDDFDDLGGEAAVRIQREMASQGTQQNLSFFAFTATPKASTLEVFGTRDASGGKPHPFHLYSMKQAIEEGFILDVLRNYTTYNRYFELVKTTAEDPARPSAKATREIMRFINLHPTNIKEKSRIIVDHFSHHVAGMLQGHAKGMVVTSSRMAAAKYYQQIKDLSKRSEYCNVRPVVAFSGNLSIDGEEVSESALNGFRSSELPKRFDTDEYNLIIVANKFQTGFDQPKLCAMYVDKKLTGVAAVQTLSRLNRTEPGKTEVFVLDFVNTSDEIQASFEPYYTVADIDRETDLNTVYIMRDDLDDFAIVHPEDVRKLAEIWYGNDENILSEVNAVLEPALHEFRKRSQEEQEEYAKRVAKFVRSYEYITQMIRLDDEELLEYHLYLRLLSKKLAGELHGGNGGTLGDIGKEINLTRFKVEKVAQEAIKLEGGENLRNNGGSAGVGHDDDVEPLSALIERLNDLFGTDFAEPAKKTIEAILGNLEQDDELVMQAKNNSREDFIDTFVAHVTREMLKSKRENSELFKLYATNQEGAQEIAKMLLDLFYRKLEGYVQ